jgi:hypothetical protein
MDFTDTQSLSDDEMGRLVSIALEEFGKELTRTQCNDVMLALFEHIAGLETLSRKRAPFGASSSYNPATDPNQRFQALTNTTIPYVPPAPGGPASHDDTLVHDPDSHCH